LERFFLDYKTLERKQVAIEKLQGRRAAETVIEDAIRLYAAEAHHLRGEA
jgi:inorganic pyrophosphatase